MCLNVRIRIIGMNPLAGFQLCRRTTDSKRGVMTYLFRPFPCHFCIRARTSLLLAPACHKDIQALPGPFVLSRSAYTYYIGKLLQTEYLPIADEPTKRQLPWSSRYGKALSGMRGRFRGNDPYRQRLFRPETYIGSSQSSNCLPYIPVISVCT